MFPIENKAAVYGEVIVYLFESCHLNCVFCHQDHSSLVGANRDSILKKAYRIIDWVNGSDSIDIFNVHLMGGEVFQDSLIDEGFLSVYEELVSLIRQDTKGKDVRISFSTALCLNNTQELINFLVSTDTKINVSYDSKGRFNLQQLKLFKANIEELSPYIELISSVMTKGTMEAIIEGDEYYSYLYQKFLCVWDTLLPVNKHSKKLMPSDSLTFNFYKVMLDNYPLSPTVAHFTDGSTHNSMSCTRTKQLTIDKDGNSLDVCPAVDFPEIELNTEATVDKFDIVEEFFTQQDCISCEFFNKCTFTCFVKSDYKYTEHDMGSICIFKELFKYVSRPGIPVSNF